MSKKSKNNLPTLIDPETKTLHNDKIQYNNWATLKPETWPWKDHTKKRLDPKRPPKIQSPQNWTADVLKRYV